MRRIFKFLSSVRLALTLLLVILVCCVVGVTILRGNRAWSLIFSTLWFNALLVLLVVNVAFCFFPRMWGRRLTVVLFGMILFHLSFVAILAGIVYNSQYYFRGLIRLTEGESLPSGDPLSYDSVEHGRFFDYSIVKGETSLIRMHRDYEIDEQNKRAAYEIEVGAEPTRKQGIIYITKSLEYRGFSYFNDKEGYSVLVILYNRSGEELYGAHVPLQSLKQPDGSFVYSTGTGQGQGYFAFPAEPAEPLFLLQVVYHPAMMTERSGSVSFKVLPLGQDDQARYPSIPDHEMLAGETSASGPDGFIHDAVESDGKGTEESEPIAEGETEIGDKVGLGEYVLSVPEVRYWVAMNVRYEPGKPIVLTSLWVALAGMVITTIGRMKRVRPFMVRSSGAGVGLQGLTDGEDA